MLHVVINPCLTRQRDSRRRCRCRRHRCRRRCVFAHRIMWLQAGTCICRGLTISFVRWTLFPRLMYICNTLH